MIGKIVKVIVDRPLGSKTSVELFQLRFFFIHCESNGISSRRSRGYHRRRRISSTTGCIAFAMMIYNTSC